MKTYNISQEINPWTFRGTKKSFRQNQKEVKSINSHSKTVPIRPQELSNPSYLSSQQKNQVLKSLRLPAIVQSPHDKNPQKSQSKQYVHLLNQQIRERFIPNYSKVKIIFGNGSKNKQKRNNSCPINRKRIIQIQNKEQILKNNTNQEQNLIELKRYKTEEIYQKQIQKINAKRASCLERKALQTLESSCQQDQSIKVTNYGKFPFNDSDISTKLRTQTQSTQNSSITREQTYKLSLMKRTYNLAKIQKMLL